MDDKRFNDIELIELVRQFSCLWDSRMSTYKNKNIKENAWTSISEIMGFSIDACQSRWLALRQRFAKEKREWQSVPSGSGADVSNKWPLFELLLFVDNIVKPRK